MAAKALLRTVTVPPTKSCTGTVIFLHGSGGTGVISKQMLKFCLGQEFEFNHMQVHYPTAPLKRYTLNGGFPQNVWFDRMSLDPASPEHLESIDEMAGKLNEVIEDEVKSGIPINRIVIGGFSMGGAMSLHVSLRHRRDIGGIFVLSSFLGHESKVYEELREGKGPVPPVFMAHGNLDDTVPFQWGKETHEKLSDLGVKSTFQAVPGIDHDHTKEEILSLKDWICNLVPFHALG